MINEIMEYNKKFVENKAYEPYLTSKYPDKKLAILTCMDTRLIELLPAALGLKNGDAKIIKNAGQAAADHRRLDHGRVLVQRRLDLGGIDVEAAADDQFARAPGDVQVAGRVDPPEVTGAKEPVGVEEGGGRLGVAEVAGGVAVPVAVSQLTEHVDPVDAVAVAAKVEACGEAANRQFGDVEGRGEVAVKDQLLINLVADDPQVMPAADLANGRDFGPGQRGAAGVADRRV